MVAYILPLPSLQCVTCKPGFGTKGYNSFCPPISLVISYLFSCTRSRGLNPMKRIGKTTVMSKIYQDLSRQGVSCSGFITEEVREGGKRTGFDVVALTGERGQLACVHDSTGNLSGHGRREIKVGQYYVNLMSFEQTALTTLKPPPPSSSNSPFIYLIDEIGKMELFSKPFIQAVRKLMSLPNVTLIATIPVPKGKPIPFVEELRGGELSQVFEVTRQNRDDILSEILQAIKSSVS